MTPGSLVVTPDAPRVALHVLDIDAVLTDRVVPSVARVFAALSAATAPGFKNTRLERARPRLPGLSRVQIGRRDDFEGWRCSPGPTAARLFNAPNQ